MKDSLTAIGQVRVIKRDNVTGEVTFDRVFKNQITNYAVNQAAQMWVGASIGQPLVYIPPSMISLGTGSPPSGQSGTSPSDTALWNEYSGSRKSVDYAEIWLNYYSQYGVTYSQTEVLGTYDATTNPTASIAVTECGLWDANGNLWSHVQLTGVTHDNQSTLSIQWQVLQQGN